MLSPESLERYRRMSLSERLELVLKMIRDETPHLLAGPPDVVDRRFELLRRENDLRNEAMLRGIARTKIPKSSPESEQPSIDGPNG